LSYQANWELVVSQNVSWTVVALVVWMMFLPPFDVLCVLSWPNEVYLFCTLVSYQLSQTKLELF